MNRSLMALVIMEHLARGSRSIIRQCIWVGNGTRGNQSDRMRGAAGVVESPREAPHP